MIRSESNCIYKTLYEYLKFRYPDVLHVILSKGNKWLKIPKTNSKHSMIKPSNIRHILTSFSPSICRHLFPELIVSLLFASSIFFTFCNWVKFSVAGKSYHLSYFINSLAFKKVYHIWLRTTYCMTNTENVSSLIKILDNCLLFNCKPGDRKTLHRKYLHLQSFYLQLVLRKFLSLIVIIFWWSNVVVW